MNSRLRSAALAAIVVFAAGRAADAAIVVGLVLDPASTAGTSPDVSSIYSGLGTWQLFAVDDNSDDFGISSYNIDLTGATTIRHTSPSACAIADANGDYHAAGFSTLRGAGATADSSFIQASQPLPDQSPFLVTGLGQQAGSFAAVAGGDPARGVTSSSWGNYNTISPLNGKNWLFLGEGTYDQGTLPSISQASFTVYNNRATLNSKMSSTAIVPEPMTPGLLTPEYLARISAPPPAPPAPQPVVAAPTNPPAVAPSPIVNPPVVNPPVAPQPVVSPPAYAPYIPPTVIPPTPSAPTQPVAPHPADQAVVVGMVVHPGSENSGSPGTWQLFAVDNNASDFGISSYNVNISGAATVHHTSPSTRALQDSDGNPIDGGFNTLRGVSGANGSYSIHASQGLPDQSPLLITGFGKGTGSFAAEAAARLGSTTLPAATSPDWGDYSSISPLDGKKWVLLADGTYDTPAPPTISQAAFTVYSDPTSFKSSMSPVTVIPEPITPTLLTQEYFEHLTPPPASVEVPAVTQPEQQTIVVSNPPIVTPPSTSPDAPPSPPVANNDPPADIQPTGVTPSPPDPNYAFHTWVLISPGETTTGVDHEGINYYTYQSIDFAASVIPNQVVPMKSCQGGLQCAMITALAGLYAAETSIDRLNPINAVPNLLFASLNAPSAELTDRVSFESAVAAPEPATLALIGLAFVGMCGMARRRRA
jgi:hypothetical protein